MDLHYDNTRYVQIRMMGEFYHDFTHIDDWVPNQELGWWVTNQTVRREISV